MWSGGTTAAHGSSRCRDAVSGLWERRCVRLTWSRGYPRPVTRTPPRRDVGRDRRVCPTTVPVVAADGLVCRSGRNWMRRQDTSLADMGDDAARHVTATTCARGTCQQVGDRLLLGV